MLSRRKRVYLHCSRTENKVQDQPQSLYILSTKQLGITSHPSEANQFALGMSDDGVYVLEPLQSKGKWGCGSQQDDGAGTSKSGAGRDSRTQRMLRNSPCIGAGKGRPGAEMKGWFYSLIIGTRSTDKIGVGKC